MFSLPSVNFNVLMSKWSFAVYTMVRFFTQVFGVTAVAFIMAGLYFYLGTKYPFNVQAVFSAAVTNPLYQALILVLILVNGRTVLFRLDDKEI
jgi:hypothetical protein